MGGWESTNGRGNPDPLLRRLRSGRQADQPPAAAALQQHLGLRLDRHPDLRDPQRPRALALPRRRQPRRRVRGPDCAAAPDPEPRSRPDPGSADHAAGGEFAGGARRPALLADRRRQPQPELSRRPGRRPDRGDRPFHRERPAAAVRCGGRPALGRQDPRLHPERPGPAERLGRSAARRQDRSARGVRGADRLRRERGPRRPDHPRRRRPGRDRRTRHRARRRRHRDPQDPEGRPCRRAQHARPLRHHAPARRGARPRRG